MSDGSGFSSLFKALIVVFVGLIVISVLLAAGAWFFWSHNKDRIVRATRGEYDQGVAAGRGTDEQGCVDQSISRLKRQGGVTAQVSTSIFLRACLEATRPTEGFCEGVPPDHAIMQSVNWRIRKCEKIRMKGDECQAVYSVVQQYCNSKTKR